MVRTCQLAPVFDDAPGKHSHAEGHGESKLDVVSGIIVTTGEIHLAGEGNTG